eukprot:2247648-Pyramimonas_sp.AAC.1
MTRPAWARAGHVHVWPDVFPALGLSVHACPPHVHPARDLKALHVCIQPCVLPASCSPRTFRVGDRLQN